MLIKFLPIAVLYSTHSILEISSLIRSYSMSISSKALCLVILGCVKERRKFPCGNSLFWFQTLSRDLHRTMSTWGKYDISIAAWLHGISNEKYRPQDIPPYLRNTTQPTYKLPLTRLKRLFPPKIAHS